MQILNNLASKTRRSIRKNAIPLIGFALLGGTGAAVLAYTKGFDAGYSVPQEVKDALTLIVNES